MPKTSMVTTIKTEINEQNLLAAGYKEFRVSSLDGCDRIPSPPR